MSDKKNSSQNNKDFLDLDEILDFSEFNSQSIPNISKNNFEKREFFIDMTSKVNHDSKNLPKANNERINMRTNPSSKINPAQRNNPAEEKNTLTNMSSNNKNFNSIFNAFNNSSLVGVGNSKLNMNKNNYNKVQNSPTNERKSSPYRFNALFNSQSVKEKNSTENQQEQRIINSNKNEKPVNKILTKSSPINIKTISKLNNIKSSCIKEYSYKEEKNPRYRNTMEDFCCIKEIFMNDYNMAFFSLYDGHGGEDSVKYVKDRMPEILARIIESNDIEKALKDAFQKIDEELKFTDSENTGCTACVVLVINDNSTRYVVSANVGDTKSMIITSDKVVQLSYDHKCTDVSEVERVKQVGGLVFNGRVFGQLVLTRALGDHALKKYGVIATPHVSKLLIGDYHKFLIIATDGVWDVITEKDILSMSQRVKSSDEFSELLVKSAIDKGSKDNISCIVICL